MWPARTPPTRVPVRGVGDQCRLGVTHLERARAGQASAACSAPLPRLYACLPSGVARKTGGPALKTTPRGSPGWGWGCEVETCEARGLGGGLRAGFPHWDTILCMSTKRPTTKKQRSSPNPSSASNAEVSGEELVERHFFWKRARARIFCWESTGGIDTNRSTIKNRVANPKSRRAGFTEGEV